MDTKNTDTTTISTSIEPWLNVKNGKDAVNFYKAAFGATETYRMEAPDGGLVVRFSLDGAGFWISADGSNNAVAGDGPVKMIITVADPDALFARALKTGATVIFPVGEAYGWRLGRLVDPFGHHWEIGRPLS